jgi:hypothetical protein
MACGCEAGTPIVVSPTHVFTHKSVTAETVFLTAPLATAGMQRIMVRWRMSVLSAHITNQLVYQYGDTLFSWTSGEVGSAVSDTDWHNMTIDVPNAQFIQVGVNVANESGHTDNFESAWIEMILTPSSF